MATKSPSTTTRPTTSRKPRHDYCGSEMLTPEEWEALLQDKREAIAYALKVFSPKRELTPEERELLEAFGDE